MTYSPVELRHVSLRRRLLGYDRGAVDAVLDDVADSYEQVWRERADLADRIENLEAELSRHKELEHLLRSTLLSAEQAANAVKEKGRSEAGEIIEDARREARDITRRARAERESLMLDARRIRLLLHAALDAIDEVPADELGDQPPVADVETTVEEEAA
jgi:cell division initiation protein